MVDLLILVLKMFSLPTPNFYIFVDILLEINLKN